MARGIKIVLPGFGYDAFTDQDPSHFSLFVDGTEDHIIIKEKVRATESVNSSSTESIPHGLSYPPLAMVFTEASAGEFVWCYGFSFYNLFQAHVTEDNLVLNNLDSSARSFNYLIFHDQL